MKPNKKNVYMVFIILIGSVLSTTMIINADESTTVSFHDITIQEGKTKRNDFSIQTDSYLGSFTINISWDETIIDIQDDIIEKQEFRAQGFVDHTNGYANITGWIEKSEGVNGSIIPLSIKIKALGSPGSISQLNILYCELLSADPTPLPIPNNSSPTIVTIIKKTDDGNGGGGGGGGGFPPPINPNEKPVANASLSETEGFVDTLIDFDASQSTDDTSISSYHWDFGDGNKGDGETTVHSYSEVGHYQVKLTVTDNEGETDTDTVDVVIAASANNPPSIPIVTGPNNGNKNISYTYHLQSTDPDGDDIRYIIDWGDGTKNTTSYIQNNTVYNVSHSWSNPDIYVLSVSTEDENNVTSAKRSLIVLIDVTIMYIDDVISGYLLDEDNNGIFDVFHNNETSDDIIVEKQGDNSYLIDSDNDDEWDYSFNISKGILTIQNQNEPEDSSHSTPGFGIGIVLIACILFIISIRRRK